MVSSISEVAILQHVGNRQGSPLSRTDYRTRGRVRPIVGVIGILFSVCRLSCALDRCRDKRSSYGQLTISGLSVDLFSYGPLLY